MSGQLSNQSIREQIYSLEALTRHIGATRRPEVGRAFWATLTERQKPNGCDRHRVLGHDPPTQCLDVRQPPRGAGWNPVLATDPAGERPSGGSYSIGRVEIPIGSRPANTQPTRAATTGMAITMTNRLFQGM